MIHPSTELRFIGSEVGFGVFATATIPVGTLVWVLDPFDRALEAAEVAVLPPALRAAIERGAFLDPAGRRIFCWDHGRHVNHSCDPNCLEIGTSFEIAGRTIEAGEELTCDYGSIGVLVPFDCRCGAIDCRGRVETSEADEPALTEDPTLFDAWERAAGLDQPLLPYAVPDPGEQGLLDDLRRRVERSRRERAAEERRRTTRRSATLRSSSGLSSPNRSSSSRSSSSRGSSSRGSSSRSAEVARDRAPSAGLAGRKKRARGGVRANGRRGRGR